MSGIGLALFIAELTGVYFTGGSLNPARTFGPAVVNHTFASYHWIYWLGPMLGAIVAAGFYKFIKILEYETANPGQDNDHAANVARRKNLLLAAGINEYDAHKVAHELTEKTTVAQAGGPDGTVIANGQGRAEHPVDAQGMYGTQFRSGSDASSIHSKRASDKSDTQGSPYQPQRPQATTTGSQIGRFSYLGDRGVAPGSGTPPIVGARAGERVDSPTMASNDQLYGQLTHGQDMALGGGVHPDVEPRQRFGRTPSSYA